MAKIVEIKRGRDFIETCEVCPYAIYDDEGVLVCESEQYKRCIKERSDTK